MTTTDRSVTPEIAAVGLIPISGNVIPHEWYKHVRRNGKVQANALIILADIVYWYRPTEIVRENNQVVRHQRKFYGDMLQANLAYYEEKFGLTKEQTREAMRCLKDDVRVIFTEIRQEPEHGRFNVPYIGIYPDRLWEITAPEDLREECPFEWVRKPSANVNPLCDEPQRVCDISQRECGTSQRECGTSQRECDISQRECDISQTNTKSSSKSSSKNSDGDRGSRRRHPAEGGLEELIDTTPKKLLLQGNGHHSRALRLQIEQQTLSDDDGMPMTVLTSLVEALSEIHQNEALINAGDDSELARMRDMARFLWRMSEKYRSPESIRQIFSVWKARHPNWKLAGRQFTQFAATLLAENETEFGGKNDSSDTDHIDYTAMARSREQSILEALENTVAGGNATSPPSP